MKNLKCYNIQSGQLKTSELGVVPNMGQYVYVLLILISQA